MSPRLLRVHPLDNVAIALDALEAGAVVRLDGVELHTSADVPAGHKVALQPLEAGDVVVKYGFPIGELTQTVHPGDWVHEHNLRTRLSGHEQYTYAPRRFSAPAPAPASTFMGYRRRNGRVGTRNEIWILNTVGCVNHAAERIAKLSAVRLATRINERFAGRIDGVHAFSHPYGCSQLGDDLGNTQAVLAGMLRHPNAGGILVLGLGCENNQMQQLLARAGDIDQTRLRFFNTQDVVDEVETGLDAIDELVGAMETD